VTLTCPKCASVDARSVVLVYREVGRPRRQLSRQAAPPRKRNVTAWLLLTLVLATAFVLELSSFGVGAVVLGGLALSGGWMTRHFRAYNVADFPDLMKRWERSVMCNRCGHVYTRPESTS
jgi:hypothetical protein